MAGFDFVRRLFNTERQADLAKPIDPNQGIVDLSRFEAETENRRVENLTNATGGLISYGSYGTDNGNDIKSIINNYREMANQADVADAINEIVNEAIIKTEDDIVSISLEDTELAEDTKEQIVKEFKDLLNVMDFTHMGDEYFYQWYVDGRLYTQNIYNVKDATDGIVGFNILSPYNLERIKTSDGKQYYIYKVEKNRKFGTGVSYDDKYAGFIIPDDHINFTPSGKKDPSDTFYISHLHRAIIAYNQLRQLEDGTVIYSLTRSIERRHFKVKTGKLPPTKADAHAKEMMNKFKNRVVYDRATGSIIQKKDVMTITEDFWSASSDDGRGVDIESVQAGTALTDLVGNMEYYKRNLLKALIVPFGRFDVAGASSISFGDNAKEINREELRFSKFINNLRDKFGRGLFIPMLKKHLSLKGIVDLDDFYEIENNIKFEWAKDSYFEEISSLERIRGKLELLGLIKEYVGKGKYYSQEYVYKNILNMTEEEIKEQQKQIKLEEKLGGVVIGDEGDMGMGTEVAPEEEGVSSFGGEEVAAPQGQSNVPEETPPTEEEKPASVGDFGGTPAEEGK
jgi:hypothetical protein